MTSGIRLEATETRPQAPQAMNGRVSGSSPQRTPKSSGTACTNWFTRSTEPPASLMATIFGKSAASRAVVSGEISITERPGTL